MKHQLNGRWSVPRRIIGIATLVLTPIRFSLVTGHGRSSWLRYAVGPHGEPVPWLTYPTVDLLKNAHLRGVRVLEFGSGQSTLWWMAQGARVFSLEDDPAWWGRVKTVVEGESQVELVDSDLRTIPRELTEQQYDIVVVDGLRRQTAARMAVGLVAPNGCIIEDDSQGEWSDTPGRFEIVEVLREAGFQRVDLYGFAPGAIRRRCTSLYFRERCFLFASDQPPERQD